MSHSTPPGARLPRRSKYGNVATIYGGVPYDSQLEADVAQVLDALQSQGRILGYNRQCSYRLSGHKGGLRAVDYIVDFRVYRQEPPEQVLIEAKGYRTPVGQLKMRWFMDKYPDIPLRVVHAPEEVIAVIEALERL